jgi:hypothetical protein
MTGTNQNESIQAEGIVLDIDIEELETRTASAFGGSSMAMDAAAIIGLAAVYSFS